MGFGLCISKMMNGIVALHSPPIRKDAAEKNGTPFRSIGCVGSRITSVLFTLKFKHVGAKCYLLYCYVAIEAFLCYFGILPGSWWAYHELGRGGRWFRDPVENASFMPRVLATACIHSVILSLLHSWTSFLNIITFRCRVSGTFLIRSGFLAPVHIFATDYIRGIFLWWFFLLMTGISMILFSRMKQQASVRRTYKKEMVVARSTLVHLRHSARA
ncbi:unnamed protein product [Withania somnifera]